ncbi:sodium/hydrogen exchanger [Desulfosarcina ovata subsp. sediminis]|uniref:Sodium/hydrogen exchanger n=1 Tax=Desulfosarcina ovata subsp. sediminis TaxID=885957 RepID=A0A5K7ZTT2_9BACT|nr:cation:proton antiporter [Desulfosarcina ovata]BBO83636.1 sodium/hydrogen exchanger [Desulfosarcina ovata subsp. sediminis]
MWQLLTKLFLLILAAYMAGILAQLFRQSAIVGYLLAGSFVGGLLFDYATVASVAELGVALLLFSIGLEFSFQQLKALGRSLLTGGVLQVILTLVAFAALLHLFMPLAQAVVIGAAFAVSSTAIVLRVLLDSTQMDSNRGRMALGILLVQDLAVVPLVLLVSLMGEAGSMTTALVRVARTMAAAGGLVLVFYLMFYRVIPWVLRREGLFANRELTILLAILSAMGAVGGAHAVGLSPALGAFLAGMLLAESPFATQIRSDIDAIRTLFVVLFFTSIGMLLDLGWLVRHLHLVLPAVLLVFLIKAVLIVGILKILRIDIQVALGTGITLGQVGEFAFVLVAAGRDGGLVGADLFAGVVAVTMLSMFLAPYMVTTADPVARKLASGLFRRPVARPAAGDSEACGKALIVGFGPAGRTVADKLKTMGMHPEVIELNPAALNHASEQGVRLHLGDGTKPDVLDHAGIHAAAVVVVTVPDSRTAADMIRTIRSTLPEVNIIARGRYHRHIPLLEAAGASLVVDEEKIVGERLADTTAMHLSETNLYDMACRMIGKAPQVPPPPAQTDEIQAEHTETVSPA